MASAIQKFVPDFAKEQTKPCAAGTTDATSGCGSAVPRQEAASKTPVVATTTGQTPQCNQNNAGMAAAGCDAGGMGMMMQGLAGTLVKLAPGSLPSH